jgi:hypothetical protein
MSIPDQEFDLVDTGACFSAVKVKVGVKCLTFKTDSFEKTSIQFQKKLFDGRDRLSLCVEHEESLETEETCNLGHVHTTSKKVPKKFAWISLDWEHVDQLIEWLQSGSWSENRRKYASRQD